MKKSSSGPSGSGFDLQRVFSLAERLELARFELESQQSQIEDIRSEAHAARQAYQELFDMLPIACLTLDRGGRIRTANSATAALLDTTPARLLGQLFLVFIARGDFRFFFQTLRQCFLDKRPASVELSLKVRRREIPVELYVARAAGRHLQYYRIVLVDLSPVRTVQATLQGVLDRWHSLVHNAPDVIMTLNRSSTILFANRSLFGTPREQLPGRTLFEVAPESEHEKLLSCVRKVFRAGEPASAAIYESVSQRWLHFHFGPVTSARPGETTANPGTTTVIIRDLTERVKAEEKLKAYSDQLRELSARLVTIREDERTRIAREIHDVLGQRLTALQMDIAWLSKRVSGREPHKRISEMARTVDETIHLVRRISSELRPSILDNFGFIAAIEWQLEQFQRRAGIRATLKHDPESIDLDQERSTALFRIVQEALTNVMRHAGAKRVAVEVSLTDGHVRLSISDDGRGISRTDIHRPASLGLLGMRERANWLGGHFEILGKRGTGTRIVVTVPLKPSPPSDASGAA